MMSTFVGSVEIELQGAVAAEGTLITLPLARWLTVIARDRTCFQLQFRLREAHVVGPLPCADRQYCSVTKALFSVHRYPLEPQGRLELSYHTPLPTF